MGVRTHELLATPEYRRHLILLFGVQLLLIIVTSFFVIILITGVTNTADDRMYAVLAVVAEKYPEAEDQVISIITEGPGPEYIEAGKKVINRYGYNSQLDDYRKPILRNVYSLSIGGLLIIFMLMLTANFFVFHTRWRSVFGKIGHLTDDISHILDGEIRFVKSTYDEGLWTLFTLRFNQMVKKMEASKEYLERDRLYLKNTLSDISHQLKTPLASLTMYNDLMQNEPDMKPEIRSDFLRQSDGQLRRMEWLVKSLLTLAQLEAGAVTYRKETMDVRTAVRKALINLSPMAGNRTISVQNTSSKEPVITGDLNWFTEALTNILKNAIQHTEENGAVAITVSGTPMFVRISVTDNGPGIPEEEYPRIFDRFFKGRNSTGVENVGIGLSLSKMIIEGHGGEVRVTPGKLQGAEFIITLSY